MYEQQRDQNQWQWLRMTAVLFASGFAVLYSIAGFIGVLG